MSEIVEVINHKPYVITGNGVNDEAISEAEQYLGLSFAPDYRDYLIAFGVVAYDGHELTGISSSRRVNVTHVTKTEWELNPLVDHKMYVVEQTHIDGIIIWQAKSGEIYQSYPSKVPVEVFRSLCDFIRQV